MATTALWLACSDVWTSVLEKMLSATTNEARTGTQPVAEDGEQSNPPESRIRRLLKSMSLGRDRVIGDVNPLGKQQTVHGEIDMRTLGTISGDGFACVIKEDSDGRGAFHS